jgi:hypothetical protein
MAPFRSRFGGSRVRRFAKPMILRGNRSESKRLVASEYHGLPRTRELPNPPKQNKNGRPRFRVTAAHASVSGLGSSPAERAAYDAERDAKGDDAVVQPDRHTRSMVNPARISKYNYAAYSITNAYEGVRPVRLGFPGAGSLPVSVFLRRFAARALSTSRARPA